MKNYFKSFTLSDWVVNGIICAIYVALTLINPLGFGAIQFRYSEALAVIPFIDRKYIPSITVGVALANLFSPLGPIDVIVGVAICIISYGISKYQKNLYVNALIYSILCGILVGLELYAVVKAPLVFTGFTVFIGQVVCTIVGAVIFKKIFERTEKLILNHQS